METVERQGELGRGVEAVREVKTWPKVIELEGQGPD